MFQCEPIQPIATRKKLKEIVLNVFIMEAVVQLLIIMMKNHRGLDERWYEVITYIIENRLCKLICVEKKLLESILFLLGLVRKNRNNLILNRSKFEEWLNKKNQCKH